MNNEKDILKLIKELKTADEIYQHKMEDPILTDEEYDAKLETLKEYSTDPTLKHLFTPNTDAWNLLENVTSTKTLETTETITHKTPMLSLEKAKDIDTLKKYINKTRLAGAKNFKFQIKLDGFALTAYYENTKLQYLATRGLKDVGENITYLINAKDLTIKGLPKTLNTNLPTEIRGEIFLNDTQFQTVDNHRIKLQQSKNQKIENFKNPRNACVGLMNKARLGLEYPVETTFATYAALQNNKPILLEKLKNENIITVDQITKEQAPNTKLKDFKTPNELYKAVNDFGEARKNFTLPSDGLVIKPTNEDEMMIKMGATAHHPLSQIAYKYPGETADTTIIEISATVGKTGKLTPTAKVTPVLIDGSLIENITMNNYNWVHEKDIRVGSKVRINKANDIIPEIKFVILNPENSVPVQTPTKCPHCQTTLEYETEDLTWPPKTIRCPNQTCPSKEFFALKTAVSKNFLDIDGLSEVTLTTLYENERVKNIADLFTLTLNELADSQLGLSKQGNPRRLGEKRAQNILNHIEKAKNLPLYRLLMSLNISHLGPSNSKTLTKHFKTIENIQKATVNEITQLEGFQTKTAEKITQDIKLRENLIKKLQSNGVKFTPEQEPNTTTTNLTGLSFAISGKVPEPFTNRTKLIEHIETNGGTFHTTPKKETNYIIADSNENSSKITKAKTLGITFITPEEFTKKYTN